MYLNAIEACAYVQSLIWKSIGYLGPTKTGMSWSAIFITQPPIGEKRRRPDP